MLHVSSDKAQSFIIDLWLLKQSIAGDQSQHGIFKFSVEEVQEVCCSQYETTPCESVHDCFSMFIFPIHGGVKSSTESTHIDSGPCKVGYLFPWGKHLRFPPLFHKEHLTSLSKTWYLLF